MQKTDFFTIFSKKMFEGIAISGPLLQNLSKHPSFTEISVHQIACRSSGLTKQCVGQKLRPYWHNHAYPI